MFTKEYRGETPKVYENTTIFHLKTRSVRFFKKSLTNLLLLLTLFLSIFLGLFYSTKSQNKPLLVRNSPKGNKEGKSLSSLSKSLKDSCRELKEFSLILPNNWEIFQSNTKDYLLKTNNLEKN